MLDDPSHWRGHYHGSEESLRVQRHYSYSDRIRYYWALPEARRAVDRLVAALDGRLVPLPLLEQHLPRLSSRANRPFDTRAALGDAVEGAQHVVGADTELHEPIRRERETAVSSSPRGF